VSLIRGRAVIQTEVCLILKPTLNYKAIFLERVVGTVNLNLQVKELLENEDGN
jgi:hypothetical protein